jgi:hypothetical protein
MFLRHIRNPYLSFHLPHKCLYEVLDMNCIIQVNVCDLFSEPVLNFLLYCLQQPHQASAAASSLQSICSACRDHMGVHFSGLVQIIQSLDTFSISNEAAIGLLKGKTCNVFILQKHSVILI